MSLELESPEEQVEDAVSVSMGFFEHLAELRRRVLISLASVAIFCMLGLAFWEQIYAYLAIPIEGAFAAAGLEKKLIFTGPLEPIRFALQLGIYAGIFLSAPVIFWQLWLFIAPGLYRREKRTALPFVFSSTVLFMVGAYFAHRVVLPITLQFLLSFGSEHFDAYISIEKYFSLWLTMVLWMGVIFEMPVLIFMLSWIGLATPAFLLHYLRHAILAIAVAAAIITPTTDVFTMAVFAVPMVALYLVGILVSGAVQWSKRRRKQATEKQATKKQATEKQDEAS